MASRLELHLPAPYRRNREGFLTVSFSGLRNAQRATAEAEMSAVDRVSWLCARRQLFLNVVVDERKECEARSGEETRLHRVAEPKPRCRSSTSFNVLLRQDAAILFDSPPDSSRMGSGLENGHQVSKEFTTDA